MADVMAVRTRFFDDFFVNAGARGHPAGGDPGVGAGLARLPVAVAATARSVYEIDQPEVIEFKTTTMTEIGATPTAERRTVGRRPARRLACGVARAAGFDETQPTAWSAEGLLVYLPPDAQDRLFDNITALSAPGSQLATEYHPDGGATVARTQRRR